MCCNGGSAEGRGVGKMVWRWGSIRLGLKYLGVLESGLIFRLGILGL